MVQGKGEDGKAAASSRSIIKEVTMVRRKFAVSMFLLVALGASMGAGPVSAKAPVLPNALQLAILRWYPAGQAASFPVGTDPAGMAFDGANIWVANDGSNNVTKLRASDGANLGTFAVGSQPFGVAFDGANIWVANFGSNNVTKLRASDGANLGTFAVGAVPNGVAFDGANIWVANVGSNNVTKLRASDGANLGTFPVGTGPIWRGLRRRQHLGGQLLAATT